MLGIVHALTCWTLNSPMTYVPISEFTDKEMQLGEVNLLKIIRWYYKMEPGEVCLPGSNSGGGSGF